MVSNKVAVLIEPRVQNELIPVLIHFAGTLSDDWGFHVFNSPKNDALLRSSVPLMRMIETGKLVITNIPSTVEFGGGELTSRFLTKPWIWEQLRPEQENILFFQTDSMICSRSNRTPEDFFNYDWVGAPWPWADSGGNGGFTLRKRSMMLKTIRDFPRPDSGQPEDVYYSFTIPKAGGKVAEKEVARHFSVEHVYQTEPLGMHQIRVADLSPQQKWELYSYCRFFRSGVESAGISSQYLTIYSLL
ncbi:hypothetical protein BDK51DRAFT_18974 [Blyttiomyces helicus]|uniref:DUF5672 domain-containing protein n=1 Tax=Blyttiomyces helicus TaxID=388810 RepID=A0A4P9WK23_9FUNG|nr:hypothetical protein BDK51DRAFT_18974 [Blyttiomyces helicus]|eukprot:RKO91490.1 hypothetical protein BDK51DRAFT_18974 [Blyttiomyces helicus]